MKTKSSVVLSVMLCISSAPAVLHASTWVKVIEEDKITVSQRPLPGKAYQQIYGVASMQGKIDPLLTILEDNSLCTQWLNDCRASKTVKQISAAERIDYTVMDAPFLLEDRDMYLRSRVSYDSRSRSVLVKLQGLENYAPAQNGKVRVLELQGHWRFQQINDQRARIEYLMYNNPQVKPVAAVNASASKGVFKTLQKLIRLAASDKFRNIKLDPARLKSITAN